MCEAHSTRQSRSSPPLGSGGHVGGEDVAGVPVEVAAGAVVAHGGAWVGVASRDLHVAQAHAGVQPGDQGVVQHVRVHPRHPDPGARGQVLEPTGAACRSIRAPTVLRRIAPPVN